MAKQRQQRDTFDVAEFLRPTDDDLKSALSSLLRDGNSFDSQVTDSTIGNKNTPKSEPVIEFPPAISLSEVETTSLPDSIPRSSGTVDPTESLTNNPSLVVEPPKIKNYARTKTGGLSVAPSASPFDISHYLRKARIAYRLNRTELVLYEMFLKWTYAIGETRCEATNRKLCEESGLIEKTVRRNLKSLRERGLITLVKAYDPYTHEPAVYDVSLPALGSI